MNKIPTPHIECEDKNLIAKTVLMPGDPLRAKFISDTFLEDPVCFNHVRGMLGYTGTYKGRRISVMGSGMGQPSIGIYSYELFNFYDVENIIRIGSAGSYVKELDVYDVVLVDSAFSESTYAKTQTLNSETPNVLYPSKSLCQKLEAIAKDINIPIKHGRTHSSDVFYRNAKFDWQDYAKEHELKCVEMESYALFHNANVSNKHAACLLTISDSFVTKEVTTSEERQKAFTNMMKIALEMAL